LLTYLIDSLLTLCAGFVQSWQSNTATKPKSVKLASSTKKPQPSSSELYDPLEGTDSDDETNDSTPTSSASSISSSSYSTSSSSSATSGLGISATQSSTSFPPPPTVTPGQLYPGVHPNSISAIPMPLPPSLHGHPPVPGLPNPVPRGSVSAPPRLPVPAMPHLPPFIPLPGSNFVPVTVPPPGVAQLAPTSVSVPLPTTASTHTAVTAPENAKSSSVLAAGKGDPSKRRFTEEKEEDGVPDDLLGYRVSWHISQCHIQVTLLGLLFDRVDLIKPVSNVCP